MSKFQNFIVALKHNCVLQLFYKKTLVPEIKKIYCTINFYYPRSLDIICTIKMPTIQGNHYVLYSFKFLSEISQGNYSIQCYFSNQTSHVVQNLKFTNIWPTITWWNKGKKWTIAYNYKLKPQFELIDKFSIFPFHWLSISFTGTITIHVSWNSHWRIWYNSINIFNNLLFMMHIYVTYPSVDRNPATLPSAKSDTMSPMWRKLVVPKSSPIFFYVLILYHFLHIQFQDSVWHISFKLKRKKGILLLIWTN